MLGCKGVVWRLDDELVDAAGVGCDEGVVCVCELRLSEFIWD